MLCCKMFNSRKYDAVSEQRFKIGDFLRNLAEVRSGDDVLDVGCTTGELTVKLAYLAYPGRVLGIDTSPEMLTVALRKARANSIPNIAFLLGDIRELNFTGEFDLVFSSFLLEWVWDQQTVLKKLLRSLRRGGRLALQLMAKDFCPPLLAALDKVIAEIIPNCPYKGGNYPWFMGEEEMCGMLVEAAGFTGLEVCRQEWPLRFASAEAAVAFFRVADLLPYLALLPETAHMTFCHRLAEELAAQCGPGEFELPYDRLFVTARKPRLGKV